MNEQACRVIDEIELVGLIAFTVSGLLDVSSGIIVSRSIDILVSAICAINILIECLSLAQLCLCKLNCICWYDLPLQLSGTTHDSIE